MKRFPLLLSLFLLSALPADADITIPTKTTIEFFRDGKPFTEPVSFQISCLGVHWSPRDQQKDPFKGKTLSPVFQVKAECSKNECSIDDSLYLNYLRIKRCDIAGLAGGRPFRIEGYASEPVPQAACKTDLEEPKRGCKLRFDLPK